MIGPFSKMPLEWHLAEGLSLSCLKNVKLLDGVRSLKHCMQGNFHDLVLAADFVFFSK